MKVFSKMLDELYEFGQMMQDIKAGKTPVNVLGVSDSVGAHLISSACQKLGASGLVVAADEMAARQIREDLQFFSELPVYAFPRSDLLFYDVEAKGQDVTRARLQALRALSAGDLCFVVTTMEALLQPTVPKRLYAENALSLKVGDEADLDALAEALTMLGYRREEMVEGAGQFSIRGGILDVFPPAEMSENPVRIEFFDTEVDSVRSFDPETQRTIDRLEKAEFLPARELLLSPTEREALIRHLQEIKAEVDPSAEREAKLLKGLERDIERLREGMLFPSLDKYLPYIYEEMPTLLEYLAQDSLVFLAEPARIREAAEAAIARRAEEVCDLAERGILLRGDMAYHFPYEKAMRRLEKLRLVGLDGISHGNTDYRPKGTYHIQSKSLGGFSGRLEFLCEALRFYQKNLYRTVILAGSPIRAKNLVEQLAAEGLRCQYQEEPTEMPNPGGILVTQGAIRRGFEYPLLHLAVLGDREVFGERKKRRKQKRHAGERITSFTDLTPGDYVVHQSHGIGVYNGIEQLTVDGVRKDYLKLSYRGSDVLYLPTDQLDMVFKHTSKDGGRVKINKLGGLEWSRTKERVKAAAANMAKDLIALYAKRSSLPGIAFQKDSEWQRDFEAAFPYEETEDQLRSIAEVKADMETPHPMDRLLCGDVGYGKTEVAMRAAFKAVMSGYQVAYLVPTTILASQHYHNFRQRMRNYPIEVGLLSRFVSGAKQKETLRALRTGELDIVIGTHKLLGKNVDFHKLGLLVIDEEQRFGVAHKEKIKELRSEVDVLTLSATPIPRTLHMSLSGIRDMSLINQPPGERYPVETYVLEYDEEVIRDAISRELARGGQVYYLFNRVEGIYQAARRIAELVPEAQVAVAHGKMQERELEEIMQEVSEGNIDVLICTTIIETGLDIANVNTMIIEDADRLGLAQLYQLRGRVGRSNRLAYAYLTFRRNKMLTQDAEKRLLAIKEFTEFGSGFKIAMQDLEIRGTGNLIGAEQHGHLEAVGYEMYCQLLEQAVKEQQGKAVEKKTETMIDLPVSAYIPEEYIKSHNQRISAYKRIAAIGSQEELYDAYDEIEDRYGTVPHTVRNLMEVAFTKAMARRCGVKEIVGSGAMVIFRFDTENLPDFTPLLALVNARPKEFFLPSVKIPKLHRRLEKPLPGKEDGYFAAIREVLEKIQPDSDEKCE